MTPRPGEISMAHGGVLFLDELAEFPRNVLEVLRQPLEEHQIHIARNYGNFTFPAEFMLVAAMNPCPCGNYPDMQKCSCTPSQIQKYLGKISQPFLDRMDLCVEVPAMSFEELQHSAGSSVTTAMLREQAEVAVEIQKKRYQEETFFYNSQIPASKLKKYCPMTSGGEELLKQMFRKMGMSARGCHRIQRVARTCADLSASEIIDREHVLEACCFRNAGKKFWEL